MSIDLDLISFLSSKENYHKYIHLVKEYVLIGNTKTLLEDIREYYIFYKDQDKMDWDSFRSWFGLVRHPNWKKEKLELHNAIIEAAKLRATLAPNDEIVRHFVKLDYASRINDVTRKIVDGTGKDDLDIIVPLVEEYRTSLNMADGTVEFAETDLAKILNDVYRSHGLEWRLEDLNVSLGPLHKGDLIIVGARPETGKTSFLCSEMTYMVPQLPTDTEAILFNNEERGKLVLRLMEAGTGRGLVDIARDENAALLTYTAATGGVNRIRVVEPSGGLSVNEIERILKAGKYGLIGLNVLDKFGGYERSETDVARQRSIAMWARNMASKYAPVIAVTQADGSAEGHQWLNMSQLYGSKTGVQGEADGILMIGSDQAHPEERYVSVCKNKLPGGPRSLPAMRHGRFTVAFNGETGRFESIMYKKGP